MKTSSGYLARCEGIHGYPVEQVFSLPLSAGAWLRELVIEIDCPKVDEIRNAVNRRQRREEQRAEEEQSTGAELVDVELEPETGQL